MLDLKSKISTFPKKPGVYQFLNNSAEVIYIGKAKNLRSRVGQYFTGHYDRPQLPYLNENTRILTEVKMRGIQSARAQSPTAKPRD